MIRIKAIDVDGNWFMISTMFGDVERAKSFINCNLRAGEYQLIKKTVTHEFVEAVTKF